MSNSFETIVIRALNSSKKISVFSYLGLRLLLENMPSKNNFDWLEQTLIRKLKFRKKWRYTQFNIFKKLDDHNNFTYREITAPSPLTLLAESYLLNIASKYECFKVPEQVFSYLWPLQDSSSYSFLYYHEGYKKRNDLITKKLLKSLDDKADLYVLILDIKDFYPSIKKDDILDKFHLKLNSIENKSDKQLLEQYLLQLLEEDGLPAGPEFAHFLANVFMEDFDSKMIEYFGNNYFRYVDDIILLVNKESQKHAYDIVKDFLPTYIELNDEKYDFISNKEWIKLSSEFNNIDFDKFHIFLNKVIAFLMHNPDKLEELKKEFVYNGFTIPFSKIYAQSINKKHISFFKYIWKKFFTKTKDISIDDLLDEGREISVDYLNKLNNLPSINNIGFKRKQLIQKYKFLINRLIYLQGLSSYKKKEKYKSLLSLIPNEEEFTQTKVLLDALINNNANEIVKYTGSTLLTFCEQTIETGHYSVNIDLEHVFNSSSSHLEILESLLVLETYGLINIKERFNDILKEYDLIPLYNFISSNPTQELRTQEINYYDEIVFLSKNSNKKKNLTLLFTKYNDKESNDLRALTLDEGSS